MHKRIKEACWVVSAALLVVLEAIVLQRMARVRRQLAETSVEERIKEAWWVVSAVLLSILHAIEFRFRERHVSGGSLQRRVRRRVHLEGAPPLGELLGGAGLVPVKGDSGCQGRSRHSGAAGLSYRLFLMRFCRPTNLRRAQ